MFNFRRKETPWEVVDSKSVDPIPTYYEDEDLDVVAMGERDIHGTFTFNVAYAERSKDLRNSVMFARQQLLLEATKNGYNILLMESWQMTILRRGKHHRVEVKYAGRPARALGKVSARRRPPFMDILHSSNLI
ncbi:hypothetical protein K443DRAFT_131892 [Laccaria amethystina LaAM-08-1]|uniref:Uncharacterized protein n=1 Tax=Laccaria amethystina LaAM-08-1 TaxID=1095629 RepID=A0A0C9Y2J2_9AGAR|nr:hypothetical protein K443DRAFT_131892 [Laccaria amethystina LaAM-08-1]